MRKLILCISCVLFSLVSMAQFSYLRIRSIDTTITGKYVDFRSPKLLMGVNVSNNPSIELGFSRFSFFKEIQYGFSISTELYFLHEYKAAVKPQIFFCRSYFNVGLGLPWYFDRNGKNSLKIRPEIGFSQDYFHITYGYNITLSNIDMNYVSHHTISVIIIIGHFRMTNLTTYEKGIRPELKD